MSGLELGLFVYAIIVSTIAGGLIGALAGLTYHDRFNRRGRELDRWERSPEAETQRLAAKDTQ